MYANRQVGTQHNRPAYLDVQMHTHKHSRCANTVNTSIHPSIQTSIHTNIHPYICTFFQKYIHTSVHPYIHASMHTYIHAYIHTYMQTNLTKAVHDLYGPCVVRGYSVHSLHGIERQHNKTFNGGHLPSRCT